MSFLLEKVGYFRVLTNCIILTQDPEKQLRLAIEAVFRSWDTERAVSYRRIEGLTGLLGTAVNVQAMVYGNTGEDSATGVASEESAQPSRPFRICRTARFEDEGPASAWMSPGAYR